jgi:hypothetical protein
LILSGSDEEAEITQYESDLAREIHKKSVEWLEIVIMMTHIFLQDITNNNHQNKQR